MKLKVKELIVMLNEYNPEASMDFIVNLDKSNNPTVDTLCSLEVIGTPDTHCSLIFKPIVKSSTEFETIFELLSERGCNELRIDINKTGIYVYANKELRREIELKYNTPLDTKANVFVKKLIEIL